jgi:hypothetical protein
MPGMLWRWISLVAVTAALAGCVGSGPAAGREQCSTSPTGGEHVQMFYLLCYNAP